MMNVAAAAIDICKILNKAHFIAYFAGGYVRDMLLQKKSSDIDIATDALPAEVCSLFPKTILVGAAFGVVIVIHEGYQFEIATFRQDREYTDGRKPSFVLLKSTPEEDAKRRDFTVNGMFFDPINQQILDFVGGQEDLEKKLIRTIGDPFIRFKEDRLRMLRAIRFEYALEFELDITTKNAIKEMSSSLIPAVSMERIYLEMNKIRNCKRFDKAFITLNEVGLLQVIFKGLITTTAQNFETRIRGIEKLSSAVPTILVLAKILENDCPIEDLTDHLKGSNEDKRWVDSYLKTKMVVTNPQSDRHAWAHIYANPKKMISLELFSLHFTEEEMTSWVLSHKKAESELSFFIKQIQNGQTLITSQDLKEIGIPPGKKMGLLLKLSEKISINEDIREKAPLLLKLKEFL